MKRKLKFLLFVLMIITLVASTMSGLHTDIFNFFNGLFSDNNETHELIIQKVSAYSASSLSTSIESVGSVNIVDVTLGNDVKYEGECLKSSPLSVGGSSAFYIDMNGHNLDIETDKTGGIFMIDSTFYVVDRVSGGHMDLDTTGSGILCKNFVIESGDVTVNAGDPTGFDGPPIPEGYTGNKNSNFDSENVEADTLGGNWYSEIYPDAWFTDGINHYYDGTWIGDAVRVMRRAIIGNNANTVASPCNTYFHYRFAAEVIALTPFTIQDFPCGLRVGSFDWTVNDGLIKVQNLGGNFIVTGCIGMFANSIELDGGHCEVYGSCGNGDPATNANFNKEAIVFSDPCGYDGHFYMGKNATLYASVPTDTSAILSYCCEYFKCEGTLYSGCRSAYFDKNGSMVMQLESCGDPNVRVDSCYAKGYAPFHGEAHKEGSAYIGGRRFDLQKSAITIDIGDVIFSGGSCNAFLVGTGCTIIAGSAYNGIWGFGVSNSPGVAHNFWNFASWEEYTNEGMIVKASLGDPNRVAWISAAQWNRIKAKNPRNADGSIKDVTITDANFPIINYQLTHGGSYTQNAGAFVMARSVGTTPDTESGNKNSAALYCIGSSAQGSSSAINIVGSKSAYTKAYFLSNEIGILATSASMRVGSNAYVSCDTVYAPERKQVTILYPTGELAWEVVAWGTYCFKGINRTDKYFNNGSALLVENSGVMECHAGGGAGGYTIGVDTPSTLMVRTGGTLRVVADSYGGNNNYSMGIHSWGDVHIESGAIVQSLAGAAALRIESGSWLCSLSIRGKNTYCNFVSRGGQFDTDNRLGWGTSYNGAVSISSIAAVYIYEGAKVECSYQDIHSRQDAAIHAGGIINVYDGATLKCTNAEWGIISYNNIKIYDDATVDISNVKKGIESVYFGFVPNSNANVGISISDNAEVNVITENSGIIGYKSVNISGNSKVVVKSTADGTSDACICTKATEGGASVNINLEKDGYVSAFIPKGAYGISNVSGNVNISGKGTVVSEGKTAGIHTNGNITINTSSDSQVKTYGTNGCGLFASNTVDIKGYGTVTSRGEEHGIFAGVKNSNGDLTAGSTGTVRISGQVKVNADGVYSGSSTISSVSLVNETETGNITSAKVPNINSYDSLQALGKDKGGFYATITSTARQLILVSESSSYDANNAARLLGRVTLTGGPEEIWYFDYIESGKFQGAFTIKNYVNNCYIAVEGNAVSGAKLVLSKSLSNACYFYIRKAKYNYNGTAANVNTDQYVLYTGYVNSSGSYVTSTDGNYGKNAGSKYCIDVNGSVGTGMAGDYGSQINDYTNVHLWANHDAGFTTDSGTVGGASVFNGNQLFSIDAIVDMGDFFKTSIKSVYNGKYLDFVSGSCSFVNTAETFEFFRDNTGLYPFSYRIANDLWYSLGLESAGSLNVICQVNNNQATQKFRICYSIGNSSCSLKNVTSVFMVGVNTSNLLKQQICSYNTNVRFVFEKCATDAIGYAADNSALHDSAFSTTAYGKAVTYRINLSTTDVNRFIMTTAYDSDVHPQSWDLYECSLYAQNMIGKRVAGGTFDSSLKSLDKIEADLSSAVKTYYLVLKSRTGADFTGIGEIDFCTSSPLNNSSGISASNAVEIKVSGKDNSVYARGQGYGIRSGRTTVIEGATSTNAYGFANVEAVSNGANGKGIYAGTGFVSSKCTLSVSGTKSGVTSGGYITIGDHSTVNAICTDNTGYGVSSSNASQKISISPYSSLYTSGKSVTGNGSVYPAPVSTFNGKAAYEVKYQYATVCDQNASSKNYGNECFTSKLYHCDTSTGSDDKKTGYSTLKSDYTEFSGNYFGLGHENDHCLYIYLPAGSYANYVTAYDMNKSNANYHVTYDIAGYNKIDNSGELMFTAKYDMNEYSNYSSQHATSAKVVSSRIEVYPLEAFSLETFKIYTSAIGGELTEEQIKEIKDNVSNSDGDTYYTWSEVRYYVENMVSNGTVYIKVLRNSLAFSTITVSDGVTVKIMADSNVKLLRAVFDTSLNVDMDGAYESSPTGRFPVQGEKNDVMLPGDARVRYFFSPSLKEYTPTLTYPSNGEGENGLTLPLFHLNGDSDLDISSNILFDNVQITNG